MGKIFSTFSTISTHLKIFRFSTIFQLIKGRLKRIENMKIVAFENVPYMRVASIMIFAPGMLHLVLIPFLVFYLRFFLAYPFGLIRAFLFY